MTEPESNWDGDGYFSDIFDTMGKDFVPPRNKIDTLIAFECWLRAADDNLWAQPLPPEVKKELCDRAQRIIKKIEQELGIDWHSYLK